MSGFLNSADDLPGDLYPEAEKEALRSDLRDRYQGYIDDHIALMEKYDQKYQWKSFKYGAWSVLFLTLGFAFQIVEAT